MHPPLKLSGPHRAACELQKNIDTIIDWTLAEEGCASSALQTVVALPLCCVSRSLHKVFHTPSKGATRLPWPWGTVLASVQMPKVGLGFAVQIDNPCHLLPHVIPGGGGVHHVKGKKSNQPQQTRILPEWQQKLLGTGDWRSLCCRTAGVMC